MIGNLSSPLIGMLAQMNEAIVGDGNVWQFMAQLGGALAFGLAAVGSSLGIGVAGRSAAGAWAKESKAGIGMRFTHIIFLGMPLSQTLYAMIVMLAINKIVARPEIAAQHAGLLLACGIAVGLAEMFSAWMQGKVGAAGIRAVSEDGKGFAFILIAMGVVETVGMFVMVFILGLLPEIPKIAETTVAG